MSHAVSSLIRSSPGHLRLACGQPNQHVLPNCPATSLVWTPLVGPNSRWLTVCLFLGGPQIGFGGSLGFPFETAKRGPLKKRETPCPCQSSSRRGGFVQCRGIWLELEGLGCIPTTLEEVGAWGGGVGRGRRVHSPKTRERVKEPKSPGIPPFPWLEPLKVAVSMERETTSRFINLTPAPQHP